MDAHNGMSAAETLALLRRIANDADLNPTQRFIIQNIVLRADGRTGMVFMSTRRMAECLRVGITTLKQTVGPEAPGRKYLRMKRHNTRRVQWKIRWRK